MHILLYAVPLFILAIVLEIHLTRKKGFYRLNDTISNFMAGMIQQIIGALPLFLAFTSYKWIFTNFAFFPDLLARDIIPVWISLFLLEDLKYYWFHRASHRVALFWAAHVVHHQSEEYNLSVAFRQSTLQDFMVIPWSWMFALMGFDPVMYFTIHLLVIAIQFWIHTQSITRLPKWLESWLNTPSHHRVHHGRNGPYIDRNYGGAFIIWDRIFGSFTPEHEEPVYGITAPTKTWNPIRAQFDTLKDLIIETRRYSLFRDKAKVVFGPPGWSPDNPRGAPEFEQRDKYNPLLSSRSSLRIGFTFGLLVALSVGYLAMLANMHMGAALATALTLALALMIVARFMEGTQIR